MGHQLRQCALWIALSLSIGTIATAADPLPKVLDARLKIELFAENPQIVTPTGMDVDAAGRVWAIESNTHFPPEGYQGHKTDRLLVLRDTNGDGRADEIKVFADNLVHAMSVAVRPPWYPLATRKSDRGDVVPRHSVYVATRKEILLLHDIDGDMQADLREQLVHLDTKGDYPHNGLAGISFDAVGHLFFGFGENLGADYKIIGSDGTTLSGGNEGGNIYRCQLDGTQLTHWATGFWNPHATCVDAYGRLFAVDNDPDSRPPCRLLHIIPNGDYGYRFRNGRKGLHPFTAWNGEIPGTLPMVAGTGEAPSGIVAYESDGFPKDYNGNLLVGSWGDHRIDRFVLRPKGGSFTSLAEPVVIGNENFRPVGLAVAPDGSLFFTDWVLREYKLHGKGRIWRLSSNRPRPLSVEPVEGLRNSSIVDLIGAINSPVLPARRMAGYLLGQSNDGLELLVSQIADRGESVRSRQEAFWAAANVARQPQPPTKLLLVLKSMSAARSLGAANTFGTGRAVDEVANAALWMTSDATLKRNPVVESLLGLMNADARDIRRGVASEERSSSLARLAAWINRPIDEDETLPPRMAADFARLSSPQPSLADPFVLSLTVDRLARVSSLEQFQKWWEVWQKPDEVREGPAGFPPQPQFSPMLRQIQAQRADHMRHARTALVLAARRRFPDNIDLLKTFLNDNEPLVKRLALQWIAEHKLKGLRPQVEALLQQDTLDSDLFLTTLATIEMLDGVSPVDFDKTPASQYVIPLVTKAGPPTVRRLALRMAAPADPALTSEVYSQLLSSPDAGLRLEAIRTLQLSPLPSAPDLLRTIAGDPKQPVIDQAEAVAGLALAAKTAAADSLLVKLLDELVLGENMAVRIEALRALRGRAGNRPSPAIARLNEELKSKPDFRGQPITSDLFEQIALASATAPPGTADATSFKNRPTSLDAWYTTAGVGSPRDGFGRSGELPRSRGGETAVSKTSDPDFGRRTFFHVNSAGCAKCHTIDGRGGRVGPDLTNIARTMDRAKLAQSILEPSREMAPQFVPWAFELKSGKVLTGLILSEESEKLKIGLPDGMIQDLTLNEIETRTPQKASIMPEKLIDQLTVQEFLDLLAFLETLK